MSIRSLLGLLFSSLLALPPCTSAALAWGDVGHKVICEIALRQVTPATRAAIDQLMRTDTEFSSFADACTWPDHPRKRAAEHFINLSRIAHGISGTDCAGAPACVVSAINKDAAVLASKSASAADRLASLKYLGHWVGDVHQPLHVSFQDDRGGNDIRTKGECSNLHAAWDSCLVVSAVGDNTASAA